MVKLLWIAFGGALGSVLRFLIGILLPKQHHDVFFLQTFTVNAVGSLLIGMVWYLVETTSINENLKLFIIIGFLGGFTTFSSFSLEMLQLIKNQNYVQAGLYFFVMNIVCISLAIGGYFIFKKLLNF